MSQIDKDLPGHYKYIRPKEKNRNKKMNYFDVNGTLALSLSLLFFKRGNIDVTFCPQAYF